MARKLLLVGAQARLPSYPTLQMTLATIVLTTSIGLHLTFRPYVSKLEDKLELASSILHMMVVLAGSLYMSDLMESPCPGL